MDVQWKHFELSDAMEVFVAPIGLHSDTFICLAWPQVRDETLVVANTDGGTSIEEDPTTFNYITKLLRERQCQL